MTKQTPILFLAALLALFSCRNYSDEEFYIQNDSDYPLQIISYYLGDTIYYASINSGDLAFMPRNPNSYENFDLAVLINVVDTDSTMIFFDLKRKLKLFSIGGAEAYEAINCKKPARNLGCTRIFHITNDHYALADSI